MTCSLSFQRILSHVFGMSPVLLSLAILAGCGCKNDRVFEDVLLSDCAPPCWRGVIPGVTTRGQIVGLLGLEPDEGDPSLPRMSWGNRCVKGGGVPQVEVSLNSAGVVASIALADASPKYTFEDVVKEWGNPGRVMSNLCAPDTNLGYIYLAYPEKGVAFATGYVPVAFEPWQHPSAKNRVHQWIYFAPTSADATLLEKGIVPGCGLPFYSESVEWSGLGP